MNIMIVGLGKIGQELTRLLSKEGYNLTVVDSNPEIIEGIINVYDVIGVCGNGANYSVQTEAGAAETDLVIATTSDDEMNILICLVAKKQGVRHTIARVRNPEYERQLRFMRDDLGLKMAVNPDRSVARDISRVLRFPSAVNMETFCKGRMELVEYRVSKGSALDGLQLSQLYRHIRVKVLITAVSRGEETFIPSGDFVLQAGDAIYLTASPANIEKFFKNLNIFRAEASSVIIVGASRMSYYLANELVQTGMSVKVIEKDAARCEWMSARLPGVLVIHGDGSDTELLAEEGVAQTDAFVALTGLDEANILMCMIASSLSDCKAVAKINSRTLSEFVSKKGMLDSVVSAGRATAERILEYVRGMQNASGTRVRSLHRIANERAEVLEFGVSGKLSFIGISLSQLNIRKGVLIAGIVRGGEIIIPSGSDELRPGDDVLVVTTDTTLRDLSDILA